VRQRSSLSRAKTDDGSQSDVCCGVGGADRRRPDGLAVADDRRCDARQPLVVLLEPDRPLQVVGERLRQ
jgi:hypothetical protein